MIRSAIWGFLCLAWLSAARWAVAAGTPEDCFTQLPFGCAVERTDTVTDAQRQAIGRKLGVPLKRLSNTVLSIHGGTVQVNLLDTETAEEAARLHAAIAKSKSHPAFCLLRDRRVIEFCKCDAAAATKAAWEIGFVPKPREVRYRVTARVATVDGGDYMTLNPLFNALLAAEAKNPGADAAARVEQLAKGLKFGRSLVLRRPAGGASAWEFVPKPAATEALAGDRVLYRFGETSERLGVPYVELRATIVCTESGTTPAQRAADPTLQSATPWWPVDDPEVAALARRITEGQATPQARVQAILQWLAPGRNIASAGPTGSRWGVKKVLAQKQGHCWDASDCFVTLARAAGVPARQVGGWLFGTSGHIWAEVLEDGGRWRQVDPTGGGRLPCGIYHIPMFTTETGDMPVLHVAMPDIEVVGAQ